MDGRGGAESESGEVPLLREGREETDRGVVDEGEEDGGGVRVQSVQEGWKPRPATSHPLGPILVSLVFAAILATFFLYLGRSSLPSDPLARARVLHRLYPMVDGHNDLAAIIRQDHHSSLETFRMELERSDTATDIPRLRRGGVSGQFWSVWVPCQSQDRDAVRETFEQIDLVKRWVERYPESFTLATSAEEIPRAHQSGRVASMIGIEGGHSIDWSLGALREFHRAGVRYMSLTHFCGTGWADSEGDQGDPPVCGGLCPFGERVVREMQRVGMMVDLAHVAPDTMRDVLDIAEAPVIWSHSSAARLCNVTRNVPDDVLRRIPDNGGVVMVNFFPAFVTCSRWAGVSDVADHIMYIIEQSGVDHVGYGSDLDGTPFTATGLGSVEDFPALTAELIRRGLSDSDVAKVIGGNLIRVWREVESYAQSRAGKSGPDESFPNPSRSSCRTPW